MRRRSVEGNAAGFIFLGAFWALCGLSMLITGSASISSFVYTELSKRHARILGAGTIVLGLVIVSISFLVGTGRFEGWDIAIGREVFVGGFFVFFAAVSVLATIMTGVQLVGWVKAAEEAGEVRRRALTTAFVLVFQGGFLIFVGIVFTSL